MSANVGLLTQTSLEPCDYAVPFSLLACVCVGVCVRLCVWRVIMTNVFHVQTKPAGYIEHL